MVPGALRLVARLASRNRVPSFAAVTAGPDRDRTDDLLDANQTLSQLSYRPKQTLRGRPLEFANTQQTNRYEIEKDRWTGLSPDSLKSFFIISECLVGLNSLSEKQK